MLTKLTLRNFQCHRKLEVPLSQITTIIGSSDSGKSAILRALNWLTFNNLRGDSFITHGQDKCSVTLEVDGKTINRIRTKQQNAYVQDNIEYNAIGYDVPPDIVKTLNMGETNVQNQHDAIFWFSLTPGQLIKELNAVADIAWVDRVLQISATDLRRLNSEIDVITERVRQFDSQVKQTEFVTEADKQFKQIEELEATTRETSNNLEKLTGLIDRFESLQKQIHQAQQIIDDFVPVQNKYNRWQEQQTVLNRLSELTANYRTDMPDITPLQKNYEEAYLLQKQYYRLDTLLTAIPEHIPDTEVITKLQKRINNLIDIQPQINRLTELIKTHEEQQYQIQESRQALAQLETELHEQTQGICPICQHPLQ